MCEILDTVVYGADGVCRIAGKSTRLLDGVDTEYFVLKPVYDEKCTIYVPVDSESARTKMRRILSSGEVDALIRGMSEEGTIWIEDETKRRECYKRILSEGDRAEMMRLIKTLYLHQRAQKEKGKKLHVSDERFMKEAERMLHDEFAHVLQIEREDVMPFIQERIHEAGEEMTG